MYERMLNKQLVPRMEELTAYCGENAERFASINAWLSAAFGTEPRVVFPYGSKYGWGVGHYRKKKLICNIFAEAGAFTVMVRLSNKQYEAVYSSVQKETQECIDNRYPCGDGGWIHYRVVSDIQDDDIRRLLEMKCGDKLH